MSSSVSGPRANENAASLPTHKREHVVQFYQDEKFLIDTVSGFVGGALAGGDAVVLIATKAHWQELEQVLRKRGLQVDFAARQGRFFALDAAETLSKFMVDGHPDEERFKRIIGGSVARAASNVAGERRGVAAFGEMVNVLWATGHYEAALRLEQLWNRLADEHSFSLLCAYPITGFSSAKHTDGFLKICAEHSAVLPSEGPSAKSHQEDQRRSALLQRQAAMLQSQTALLQSEQRFRLFVDAVRDYAIFMLDPQGNISTWNKGAERIKGYKPWEIIGRHFSVFYPEEDLKSRKPWMELEVAAAEGRFEDEGWRLRKDGSKFWANVIITAIKDENGHLLGFGKVTRDLTEKALSRMQLENALKELEKEVKERRKAEARLHRSEESLRRLSLHLLRTQDEERKRIGRDLHDSLGQSLAIAKINLESLQLALPLSETKSQSQVGQCVKLIEEALREVRTIAYLLYPPMLEELGLNSAIQWYLEGFSGRSRIRTSFDVQPDLGRLPRGAELALFRVLQESLTNVHRHSGSETAQVRLFEENGTVVLEIEDQGNGFPSEMLDLNDDDAPSSFGVGLRGMNERMCELGGKIQLRPAKKQGAIVRAVVPREHSTADGSEEQDTAA